MFSVAVKFKTCLHNKSIRFQTPFVSPLLFYSPENCVWSKQGSGSCRILEIFSSIAALLKITQIDWWCPRWCPWDTTWDNTNLVWDSTNPLLSQGHHLGQHQSRVGQQCTNYTTLRIFGGILVNLTKI